MAPMSPVVVPQLGDEALAQLTGSDDLEGFVRDQDGLHSLEKLANVLVAMPLRIVRPATATPMPDHRVMAHVIRRSLVNGNLGRHPGFDHGIPPAQDAGAFSVDPDQCELPRLGPSRTLRVSAHDRRFRILPGKNRPGEIFFHLSLRACPCEPSFRIFGFRPLWVECMIDHGRRE